ncbi:YbaB/EbfC family nucleoid-associated protein [Saccharothrix sp. HUAS TT1]|uniref:YbaB/EbfC family nucleoid-associated protein n=1 Tax=unclassified Saccharothrix TaxID=2593673 RepID=UPI00345B5E01
MNPERVIADLEATARDLSDRSRGLRDRLRRVEATQRSADGVVTVTVAPNGSLRHIEFSPDVTGCSPARLGEVVLETVRQAQAQAARQVVASVEPQFAGTAAMRFLVGSAPPAAAEPELPLPRSLWAPADDPEAGTAPR